MAASRGPGYRRGMSTGSRFERWLRSWKRLPHPIRWIAVASVGSTLVVIGIVLLVLPGPGIPMIIAGLAILATEFAWAEVTLRHVRTHGTRAAIAAKDTALRAVRRSPRAKRPSQ